MENKAQQSEEKKTGNAGDYPIVGKSRAVEQLIKQIGKLAKSRRDVVIIGEAGVGKGAVAKNIYYLSKTDKGEQPFMSINLSVLDDKELEAVLFGFDRGVEGLPYTSKRGLFELANGGTVLIEEIEEASFRNQMKILNFMNERKTRRIGGETGEPVDIRLVVTLKGDPAELVEKRKLLEDGLRRQQRIAAVVTLARQHEHAAAVGEPADLPEIREHRPGHARAGAPHRRPLALLVAAEQPLFQRPGGDARQNGIRPRGVHRGNRFGSIGSQRTERIIGDHRVGRGGPIPADHFGQRTSAATAIATSAVCDSDTRTCVAPVWASSAAPFSSNRTNGSFRDPW